MTEPESIVLTELRESPRRPGRYLLTLSDGRQLVLGVAALADAGVTRSGVALSPATVAALDHESAITALADRALDALARGRRTRRELEMRLRKREATPAQIREALDRLATSGLLSDESVAQAEAAARLRRGEAPTHVRRVLRRKGVSGATVSDAVADAIEHDEYDELAACRSVAEKRARSLASADPATAERRLLGYLLRRGYGSGVARQVVRVLLRGGGA